MKWFLRLCQDRENHFNECAMPFMVGENVGPYRLLEQLGQGGMATVFKAYHPVLDRYVAIKALHTAFTLEPNFLARFQREAQVVAKLEHPNIVPIYDYAEHEGRPYLVMKFIQGETLKARLARGPLESVEILKIVESVGAALSYAHAQGVLHRDIKPSNVLLASDDRIYLADFGLARMAQAGDSTISSDIIMGTPQYISPEQAMSRRDLDNGTDIYSFGVLLYELVVGRVPFSADTPFSIIHDHIYAPLPLPRKIKPEIPEAVELVLLKALAKDRQDRFPDIASMVEAWKQAVGALDETRLAAPVSTPVLDKPAETPVSAPVPAEPVETPVVARRKPRNIWLILVGVLVVFCLCAAMSLALSPRLRGSVKHIKDLRNSPTPAVQLDVSAAPILTPSQGAPLSTLPLPLPTLAATDVDKTMALISAGDGYFRQEDWMRAADSYLQAISGMTGPVPPGAMDNLNQSLYLAASSPEMESLLAREELNRLQPEVVDLVHARYVLFNKNDVSRAQEMLTKLKTDHPGFREAELLDAEILFENNKPLQARKMFQSLAKDPNLPSWVRQTAKYLGNPK